MTREKILSTYTTNPDSDIYCIRDIPEEVIAVLFAYYSRSKGSLKDNLVKIFEEGHLPCEPDWNEILEKTNDPQLKAWLDGRQLKTTNAAQEFHEKWVVNYGHSSVAENAVAHVAFENVSILATKEIEDNRLASYIEKSTRYVVYDNVEYYKPKEITNKIYQESCDFSISKYLELTKRFTDKFIKDGDKPAAAKAKACDITRTLLPCSTFTNLGMTTNARNFEHSISKWLSNPLTEVQEIGTKVKIEVQKICPTLVKYANPNEYRKILYQEPNRSLSYNSPITLECLCENPVVRLAANILYEKDNGSIKSIMENCEKKGREYCKDIISDYLKGRGAHDNPGRALESVYFNTDLTINYGAYRDIQRHRMSTQLNQLLGVNLGYVTPNEINANGWFKEFDSVMKKAQKAYGEISHECDARIAQYVLPMAFNKRVSYTWNLRELFHFIELRSKEGGHKDYISIAQDLYYELRNKYDNILSDFIRIAG